MPLYDFRCRNCGERFEDLVPESQTSSCPACGTPDAERLLGSFAGPFTVALRGVAARRSNAKRRVREELRSERRAERDTHRKEQQ